MRLCIFLITNYPWYVPYRAKYLLPHRKYFTVNRMWLQGNISPSPVFIAITVGYYIPGYINVHYTRNSMVFADEQNLLFVRCSRMSLIWLAILQSCWGIRWQLLNDSRESDIRWMNYKLRQSSYIKIVTCLCFSISLHFRFKMFFTIVSKECLISEQKLICMSAITPIQKVIFHKGE